MEEGSAGSSPIKTAAASGDGKGVNKRNDAAEPGQDKGVIKKSNNGAKRGRFDRCISFVEISIDPGVKSLKQLDSKKFKEDIKRWAKRVAAYARQLSDHFGSSRR